MSEWDGLRLEGYEEEANATVWRLICDIRLQQGSTTVLGAIEEIVRADERLNLPQNVLRQLQSAATGAVVPAKNPQREEIPYRLRLFLREPLKSKAAARETSQLEENYQANGWGFFIVQKYTREGPATAAAQVNVVELFLYCES